MTDRAETFLDWLETLPEWLLYALIGTAAALENVVPPIPADVFVVIGGVIAGGGLASPRLLFLVVWLANSGSALLIFALGRRFGPTFFQGRLGRVLLAPAQVVLLARAYRRWGIPIIFVSRFLPVFRPVVPAFAGVAGVGLLRAALPIAAASAIWYGLLVYLGTLAGANLPLVLERLERIGGWLWLLASLLIGLMLMWWWRTRGTDDPYDGDHRDRLTEGGRGE
jgi:membrane protein DedA with SNARE-associated domain